MTISLRPLHQPAMVITGAASGIGLAAAALLIHAAARSDGSGPGGMPTSCRSARLAGEEVDALDTDTAVQPVVRHAGQAVANAASAMRAGELQHPARAVVSPRRP